MRETLSVVLLNRSHVYSRDLFSKNSMFLMLNELGYYGVAVMPLV